MTAAMTNKAARSDYYVAAALLAVLGPGYGLLAGFFPTISPDGFLYLELAKNVFRTGWEIGGEPHQKFLPLYPLLMAMGDLATGRLLGPDVWGVAISALSGALLPPLTFLLSRRLRASRFSALLTALLAAVIAVNLNQYRDLNVIPVFTVGLALMLWLWSGERFGLAGVVMGLAAVTRYEAYMILPLFLLIHLRKTRGLVLGTIGFLAPVLPWWIYNLSQFGHATPSLYFMELFNYRFHLTAIVLDLLKDFGPVLLLAAGIGLVRLEAKWKLGLGGFGLGYLVLHTFWWYYADRFLVPLMPLILPAAAL